MEKIYFNSKLHFWKRGYHSMCVTVLRGLMVGNDASFARSLPELWLTKFSCTKQKGDRKSLVDT
jgi:hypothetical protein